MTTKDALHRLVDELPEHQVEAARELLERLRDPVLGALLGAPEDDELLTQEEEAALGDREGAVISHAELMRELGL